MSLSIKVDYLLLCYVCLCLFKVVQFSCYDSNLIFLTDQLFNKTFNLRSLFSFNVI